MVIISLVIIYWLISLGYYLLAIISLVISDFQVKDFIDALQAGLVDRPPARYIYIYILCVYMYIYIYIYIYIHADLGVCSFLE